MLRPRKKYTVADLRQLKGQRCLTHIHVKSPEEAAAAEAAGVDLMSCSFDSPEAQARVTAYVEEVANTRLYLHALRVVTLDDPLVVAIADNGRGFDSRGGTGVGMGRLGMEERARLMGGRLTVVSQPQGGTVVTVRIADPGPA